MNKDYIDGWNAAIEEAMEACLSCGEMAEMVTGVDSGSGAAFSAAISGLRKSVQTPEETSQDA